MRTGNPALSDLTFSRLGSVARTEERMSIQGTTNKAILLLLCVCVTATWIWSFSRAGNPQVVLPLVTLGAIAGFIVALVTVFKPAWAGVTAPLYALLEGLLIGGISAIAEARYPGIVI